MSDELQYTNYETEPEQLVNNLIQEISKHNKVDALVIMASYDDGKLFTIDTVGQDMIKLGLAEYLKKCILEDGEIDEPKQP